ncbi:MAG: 4'-phosphopantetheinyl transferase family protein, partial [Kiloniellaceae bacterium]
MMTGPCDSWPCPPDLPTLSGREVHVWRVALDVGPKHAAGLEAMISADERARAARYRRAENRIRFIAGRGTLRRLLGAYLRRDPRALAFGYGAWGKPVLIEGGGLAFNLSHARDLALVAVARGCDVGVDVEWIRPVA